MSSNAPTSQIKVIVPPLHPNPSPPFSTTRPRECAVLCLVFLNTELYFSKLLIPFYLLLHQVSKKTNLKSNFWYITRSFQFCELCIAALFSDISKIICPKNSTKPKKSPPKSPIPLPLLILCRVFVTTKKNRCKQQIICVSFVIKAVFSGKKKGQKGLCQRPNFHRRINEI